MDNDKLRAALQAHFIVQIECEHPVDRAHCICGWISSWAKNVGEAGKLWVAHVETLLAAEKPPATGFLTLSEGIEQGRQEGYAQGYECGKVAARNAALEEAAKICDATAIRAKMPASVPQFPEHYIAFATAEDAHNAATILAQGRSASADRGPFLYAIEDERGNWHDGEQCVFGDRSSAQEEVDLLNDEFEEGKEEYNVVPLYRVLPACASADRVRELLTMLPGPDEYFYVEHRGSGNNYRGPELRFVVDRRGRQVEGKCGYENEDVFEWIKRLVTLAAPPAKEPAK